MTRRALAIPRQSIGDLRRAELIDAAILTLAQKGYEKATVRDVARAAGASPASVLYYFESAEALLAAAFERADKEFRDHVRSELAPLNGTARLRRLVELCLPAPSEASSAWAVEMEFWALAARRADFRTIFGVANDDWLSIINEAFEQAIDAGELPKPGNVRDAVIALAALIDGLAVYTRVTDGITAAQARRIALVEVERLRSVKTPSPRGRRSHNSKARNVSPNRIGVAACTWGLEPGYPWVPQYDPAEVLAAAARLGFSGYEPASESGPGARVAEQAARVGLACPARFVGLSLADSDQARRDGRAALDDLLALGGQMLLVAVEELGDTQPLAELADSCVHAGVTAAIHPELGSPVATADVVDELLAVSPALAVCVDTGHFWAAGDHDLPELVRWWDRRIAHVHLKDVAAEEAAAVSAGKPVLEAVQAGLWQPLGEGSVPLAETLEVLEQQGYAGWLIVEHDFAPDPEGSAAAGLAWVEAVRR